MLQSPASSRPVRRPRAALALLWLAITLTTSLSAQADEVERPNVLLIVVDDLKTSLGCYGHPRAETPHIDRLAARAVRFDHAYVQYPVCNPSRSSFLTGLRPDQTGITDNRTPLRDQLPAAITLPQHLRQHGWQTAAFGKIFHLGGGRNAQAQARWMDLPLSWDVAETFQPTAIGKRKLAGRNLTDDQLEWCHWGAMDGSDDDQPDGQIAAAVVDRIAAAGDQPWFIGAGFLKPHDPFLAPQKYFEQYPADSLILHRDPADLTPVSPLAIGFGAFGAAFSRFTEQEQLEFLRAYYACTSFMDAQVGRVLAALEERQLWDRTIVILIGDHGYHLGERNWWNKNTLFEHSCRAPLLIAVPAGSPGAASGLVEFVDLFPTIADYCHIPPPPGLAGQSLRPQLTDPTTRGKPCALTVITRGPNERGDSVRTARWRYTRWSDGTEELYDHLTDPGETHSVADSNREVIAELAPLLPTPATPLKN